LKAAYYAEWVLGVNREQTQLHVQTMVDKTTNALIASNPYHPELPRQVAFLTATGDARSFTGDRTEFIGRHGRLFDPQGMRQLQLSGRVGAGFDPCGAVMVPLHVAASGQVEIVFLIGSAETEAGAIELLSRYGTHDAARKAADETRARWNADLTRIQVRTPLPSLDLMVNRWLLYQALSCRVWGRTAFYQCGGAYGFRDQLQDGMALAYARPDLTRAHLLVAASRQFEEGDVQHWWHPPIGRGTRTRYSDDALWLPFATCHYAELTGDTLVWDEQVHFLRSPVLELHEEERYELPAISPIEASLYEHCRRAFLRALRTGPHGISLMGGGDWNDGMNKVGPLGQGESVWLGWFLLVLSDKFLSIMRERESPDMLREIETQLGQLRGALENAWDGEWYRRAYFDDGSPLGSQENDECRIDSIAQSWAVLAGADPARGRQAMESVWNRLISRDVPLARLFTPPFDKGRENPGYIKGYPPGIRENGGQYTHAATWLVRSYARLGAADRALAVFRMINPLDRAGSPEEVECYRVEPYVVAADIYGVDPHVGRGGWTWYTGSASWTYRVALEDILGFHRAGRRVRISPCIPDEWDQFEIDYRHGDALYHIVVHHRPAKTGASPSISVDGVLSAGTEFELKEDGGKHEVIVEWIGKHEGKSDAVHRHDAATHSETNGEPHSNPSFAPSPPKQEV
jgi:cyclic beta-1,2-glucan synthetase